MELLNSRIPALIKFRIVYTVLSGITYFPFYIFPRNTMLQDSLYIFHDKMHFSLVISFQTFAARSRHALSTESNHPYFFRIPFIRKKFYSEQISEFSLILTTSSQWTIVIYLFIIKISTSYYIFQSSLPSQLQPLPWVALETSCWLRFIKKKSVSHCIKTKRVNYKFKTVSSRNIFFFYFSSIHNTSCNITNWRNLLKVMNKVQRFLPAMG